MTATILKYVCGGWDVQLGGDGWPVQVHISTVRLEQLVGEGYRIEDPRHLVDTYCPVRATSMRKDAISASGLDADSADYLGAGAWIIEQRDYGHEIEEEQDGADQDGECDV